MKLRNIIKYTLFGILFLLSFTIYSFVTQTKIGEEFNFTYVEKEDLSGFEAAKAGFAVRDASLNTEFTRKDIVEVTVIPDGFLSWKILKQDTIKTYLYQ